MTLRCPMCSPSSPSRAVLWASAASVHTGPVAPRSQSLLSDEREGPGLHLLEQVGQGRRPLLTCRKEASPFMRPGSPPAQRPLKSVLKELQGGAEGETCVSPHPPAPGLLPLCLPSTASCHGHRHSDSRCLLRFELLTLPVLRTAEPGWNFPKRRC